MTERTPVDTVRLAIEAVKELKAFYKEKFEEEAPSDIGVYVDNEGDVGDEIIRYDGTYVELIYYYGASGTYYEFHEKWVEILRNKFEDDKGGWDFTTHFAVSVYGHRRDPTAKELDEIRNMLTKFDQEKDKQY